MLPYNEVKEKKYIIMEGAPYEVLSSQVVKKQRQKPTNQTKLKNLVTGNVTEKTFHQSDKVEEADIETKKIKYLYNNRGEFWFCEERDPSKRFSLPETLIGNKRKFLKENTLVEKLSFKEQTIGIKVPIKVELIVTEAPPSLRGNTAQGGTKQVTLETGAVIATPLFVKVGDIIRVNTETGAYVERVQKI